MNPLPYQGPNDLPTVLRGIADRAATYEADFLWPALDLQALAAAGAMRWAVPREFGGDELSPRELHLKYEQLAAASLGTALILTQRDAAIGLIEGASGAKHREEMLRRLANNEHMTTVGIAQLTTSRQGSSPSLAAERVDGGYRLNGVIPWCTGAGESQFIVAGAALVDQSQILFLLEPHAAGVTINPPLDTVALRHTLTTSLSLSDVVIRDDWLLAGPVERALSCRRRNLNLGQAFLATGLCRAALDLIHRHESDPAKAAGERFESQLKTIRDEVIALSAPGREKEAADAGPRLRGAVNDLALRITHAAVALYKGTALLREHPAQRYAREAMFLLVWSCPNPVIDCTVDLLSNP